MCQNTRTIQNKLNNNIVVVPVLCILVYDIIK